MRRERSSRRRGRLLLLRPSSPPGSSSELPRVHATQTTPTRCRAFGAVPRPIRPGVLRVHAAGTFVAGPSGAGSYCSASSLTPSMAPLVGRSSRRMHATQTPPTRCRAFGTVAPCGIRMFMAACGPAIMLRVGSSAAWPRPLPGFDRRFVAPFGCDAAGTFVAGPSGAGSSCSASSLTPSVAPLVGRSSRRMRATQTPPTRCRTFGIVPWVDLRGGTASGRCARRRKRGSGGIGLVAYFWLGWGD